jgi:hypothetical protein
MWVFPVQAACWLEERGSEQCLRNRLRHIKRGSSHLKMYSRNRAISPRPVPVAHSFVVASVEKRYDA